MIPEGLVILVFAISSPFLRLGNRSLEEEVVAVPVSELDEEVVVGVASRLKQYDDSCFVVAFTSTALPSPSPQTAP